jgi:hypothetical protein
MNDRKKEIDLLVEQFWKRGYLTLSRKYGTYLPEPSNIGGFEIDIIARQKDNYAIGLTLDQTDLHDTTLINRLRYLATRQTKNSNKKVLLFVGVSKTDFPSAKKLLNSIEEDIRKNIRLFLIEERADQKPIRRQEKILFS